MNLSYVDLYYAHIWDTQTPIEEMIRAFDDVVRSGKALYIGISDAPAWVVSRANTIAELRGLTQFIALQSRYNMIDRSLEGDLGPMAHALGLGVCAWGCLAEGFLTGKHKQGEKLETSGRNETVANHFAKEQNSKVLNEVLDISKEVGRSPSQVALNWTLQRPAVVPIIGARNIQQLEENVNALSFKLTPEQMKRLNDASKPDLPFPHPWLNNRKPPAKTAERVTNRWLQ